MVTDSRPRKTKCKPRNGASEQQPYFTPVSAPPRANNPAWGAGVNEDKIQDW